MFRIVNKDNFSPLVTDRDPEKGGWFTKVKLYLEGLYKGPEQDADGVERSSVTLNDCKKVPSRMWMV